MLCTPPKEYCMLDNKLGRSTSPIQLYTSSALLRELRGVRKPDTPNREILSFSTEIGASARQWRRWLRSSLSTPALRYPDTYILSAMTKMTYSENSKMSRVDSCFSSTRKFLAQNMPTCAAATMVKTTMANTLAGAVPPMRMLTAIIKATCMIVGIIPSKSDFFLFFFFSISAFLIAANMPTALFPAELIGGCTSKPPILVAI
mmetsp:Transcript_5008/g.10787  ORF Transcript_5008/g.10787 Transcript_5008/m.10787 type:complete len:203 (+) Transcript_5008:2349-2957(+)